ncbi:MAG: biotin/lipoyl-binding protein [Bacteroidales bacterium]|jgi:biotin carboxyl carrier protein|nr:biotin/lipoyl-binding protein [Bacteroidales bacterium]
MKKYKFTIHGNTYETEITNVEGSVLNIEINGTPYEVTVDKEIKQPVAIVNPAAIAAASARPVVNTTPVPDVSGIKPSGGSSAGDNEVKSPLPGTVINIFVKTGDTVKTGQKIMVLEAMKMENNIDAEKDGVIKSIKVKQGDAVMEGDTLFVIG